MAPPLRILHLEDNPVDAELIRETLEVNGIACETTRVDTEAGFAALLKESCFDLILADYTLPSFDGLSALRLARKGLPLVPFIFVSGTLDEDLAIEALKIGATDYVFKTRLSRLTPSVQRSLREAAERSELARAEQALRRSEAYLAQAQELSHTGSFGWDTASGELFWSRETFRIFGMEAGAKVTEDLIISRTHPEDRPVLLECMERARRDRRSFELEHRLLLPDGSVKHLKVVAHPTGAESGSFEFAGAVIDISRQKRDEADIQKALAEINQLKEQLYRENIALRDEIDKTSMFEEIVGESPALHAVLARVAKVAPTDSTVLINGETGTGKELIARAIHKRSGRAARAFVAVNCAAIPSSLIGSELFGHERGAFTGALQRRLGRFELAEGGTIFLDEIGELPTETQVALLRVLQEREFERIGGSQPIRADVRVITATNRDLESEIANGTFRKDLYYRLNVFPIQIPPLRERKEDIPTLVEYFILRYSKKAGKKVGSIDKKTLESLELYGWPGNIRELQNVIERSIIVYEEGDPFSVDPSWLSGSGRADAPVHEKGLEKEIIEAALAASGGRVSGPTGAASQLGVPASTLESKIRSLRINKYRFKNA
ncbi:MAG TPA: sigma 54-interacting transcriptional regulator [Bryobacteraceae bacterium]|jgi:PAS domain S-box-containing protein|nr:sigma 54-interacting transcriptional regulator [Bryobacteraceae bacterium]